MEELKRHEIFELEILEDLKKVGFMESLVFGGGTMLRLCHELPRFSVDLDFWFWKQSNFKTFFSKLKDYLDKKYIVTDAKDKYFTLLYELKGKGLDRKLKLEIRKEIVRSGVESQIAYSPYSDRQVAVRSFSLEEMARRKVAAALDRSELRDFFDLEFLLRKGAFLPIPMDKISELSKKISRFEKPAYLSALGGLLEKDMREYYRKSGFALLKTHLLSRSAGN